MLRMHTFYLLDDGKQPITLLLYPMLQRALALLPEWAEVLWRDGRVRGRVSLLGDGAGQCYAAWRVLPISKEWQSVIQEGPQKMIVSF